MEGEELLPTYEAATKRDPLPLVASYLRREDLFTVSLVCRRWREAFREELWRCPGDLWGMGERSVLTSFLLFLRTISTPLHTIPQTRTLSLTSITPTIYTTPPNSWLSHLYHYLPNLQTLIIPALPFFDHSSLTLLSTSTSSPHTNLVKLSATGCTNTTASGIKTLLQRTPELRCLDLSRSNGVNHPSTLAAIASLQKLSELALRKLNLDDDAIGVLARGLGTKLWKLDLGGNLLTDLAVAGRNGLLDWCFAPPEYALHIYDSFPAAPDREERYNQSQPPPPSPSRIPPEAKKGLTHLRLSCNPKLTTTSITSLLKSTRLQTLDIGQIITIPHFQVSNLIPLLALYAHNILQVLRIDHRIIISCSHIANETLKPAMVPALKTLVLCGVPSVAGKVVVEGLCSFLEELAREERGAGIRLQLKVLELEVVGVGIESMSQTTEKDFSFFAGESEEGEGEGSNWREHGGGGGGGGDEMVIDLIEELTKIRRRGKADGSAWSGVVRVIEDLDESEGMERTLPG